MNKANFNVQIIIGIALLTLYPAAGYLFILLILMANLIGERRTGIISAAKKDFGFLILIGTLAISTLVSQKPIISWLGFGGLLLQFYFYLLIREHIKEPKQILKIIYAFIGASFLISLFGLGQYIYNAYNLPSSWLASHFNRIDATFFNANVFGSFMIILVSFGFTGILHLRSRWKKILANLILLSSIAALFLTFSRGAWAGALVGMAVIFLIKQKEGWTKWSYRLPVILIVLYTQISLIGKRLNLDNVFNEPSFIYRWYIWKFALEKVWDYPFFGIGIGAFSQVLSMESQFPGVKINHVHNFYLQLIVETGIFGYLLILGFIISAIYGCLRIYLFSTCRKTKAISLGTIASFIGLLIHGIVDSTLYLPQISIFLWILIALTRNLEELEFGSLSIKILFNRYKKPVADLLPKLRQSEMLNVLLNSLSIKIYK